MNNRNVYDIEVSDYKGLTYKLEAFRGKVILVVNTATECIYSEQLKKLETLFQKYKDRGFVVLSFPNNNFDNRQPGIFGSPIKWNFTKFIIDRQGNVVNRFLPMEDPLDISTNIEILLQESSS